MPYLSGKSYLALVLLLLVVALYPSRVLCAPATVIRIARLEDGRNRLISSIRKNGGRVTLFAKPETLFPLLVSSIPDDLKSCLVVIPSTNRITPEIALALRELMGYENVPETIREAFKLTDGVFEGKISGREFRFVALPDLPIQAKPVAVLIETSFLAGIFENEVKSPIVVETKRLFLTLQNRKVLAGEILWLDDSSRPDYPFDFAFLYPLFREMVSNPDAFIEKVPEKWDLLSEADHFRFFQQNEEAYGKYRQYLDLEPGDPSACLKIAYMAASESEAELALTWLDRAISLNSDYRRVFPDFERYFSAKGTPAGAELIRKAFDNGASGVK